MHPVTTPATSDVGRVPAPGAMSRSLIEGLSRASVKRRWEAYRDIDWDAPEHALQADAPAWEADGSWDPLAAAPWYRDQSPTTRAEIGLRRMVEMFSAGIAAEAVLSQGLLRYARTLPEGHPAFRYAYHEIAEEVQHTLMFQEFILRSGVVPVGPSAAVRERFDGFAGFGDASPVLFLVAALATEEAFDHVQRRLLATPSIHPLVRRIFRIHVTEEARHLSFAGAVLRDVVPRHLPRLGGRQVRELRLQVPLVISWTATHMVDHSDAFFDACDAPTEARHEITHGIRAQDLRRQGTARVTALCHELGLVDRRLEPTPGRT